MWKMKTMVRKSLILHQWVTEKLINGGDVLEYRGTMGGSNLWLVEDNLVSLLRFGSYMVCTCGKRKTY